MRMARPSTNGTGRPGSVMVKEPAASGQIEGAEASSWMEEIGSDFSSWGESSLRELESGDEPLL